MVEDWGYSTTMEIVVASWVLGDVKVVRIQRDCGVVRRRGLVVWNGRFISLVRVVRRAGWHLQLVARFDKLLLLLYIMWGSWCQGCRIVTVSGY